MTDRERAIVMAYTGVVMLVGDKLGEFYKYCEEILGFPVYTHMLASRKFNEQLKKAAEKDFISLCAGTRPPKPPLGKLREPLC